MRKRAVVLLVTTLACKTHHEAAPSSDATTAPSSFPSVAVAPASVSVAEAPDAAGVDAAALAKTREEEEQEEILRILSGSSNYGSDAGLAGVSGPGVPPHVGPTRFPAGSRPVSAVRMGSITVNGRLPKEVVQRIVRRRFGSFRLCYEKALALNPSLTGRVTTRFVISADGTVTTSQDSGSELADKTAVDCVVRQFGAMEFPKPEAGIVVATVPLTFSTSQP